MSQVEEAQQTLCDFVWSQLHVNMIQISKENTLGIGWKCMPERHLNHCYTVIHHDQGTLKKKALNWGLDYSLSVIPPFIEESRQTVGLENLQGHTSSTKATPPRSSKQFTTWEPSMQIYEPIVHPNHHRDKGENQVSH